MDKQSAIRLLNETFNSNFDVEKYIKFIKELFNNFVVSERTWNVWKEYQDYIDSYQLIGSYTHKKETIDVLIVKLKRTSSRDRARTMQRNFIAKYLSNTEKNAALIAFYGDDPQDWRFSFVKMEYNLVKDESGKVQVAKELTPAKRYSFLVGVNEPNHTCRSQFLNLVMEEEVNPSLTDLEAAFSIDNVTKEFFMKYKELFLTLVDSLQNVMNKNIFVKKEFEEKNISPVDFSKKLLGQIVFIYFLQKKGWLGVGRDKNGRFREWGTGPKNFLRKLFDKEIVSYDNFFNEVLEPLFYEALATERDDDYYSRFKCKIPFLNGGLFEPINDYDWAGTEITLDNSIFDNILSTFDQFNFTVKEDEPLEKEVAVDPEMLGKVFENLLEVTDRKSKGAFYTPREIVHYMCQQSLINYIATHTSISRKDIERFIQLGDLTLDRIIKEQEQIKKYGRSYDIKEEYSLPKSIKENYKEIDRLLREIKIVDPAVGSGAFPVGMMNEIVKARSILSIYSNEDRSNYILKREIIESCLYGVDFEPSAVEITKLRFWLSLIVDELDMRNIKPLPNLDHKIMCGNSLLEDFEGIKLFDETLLGEIKKDVSSEIKHIDDEINRLYKARGAIALGKKIDSNLKTIDKEINKLKKKKKQIQSGPQDTTRNLTLDEAMQIRIKESQKKLTELKALHKEFFNEQNRKIKKRLRETIERIEWELIEETLKEQGNQKAMQKLEQYKKNNVKPFFLWKLNFTEIFQRKNPGFDVVIGNPPYGFRDVLTKEDKEYFRKIEKIEFKSGDSAELFCKKCFDSLARNDGILTFIIPKKSLYGDSWEGLRVDYWRKYNLLFILDSSKAFEKVLLEASAFGLQKTEQKHSVKLSYLSKDDRITEFANEEKENILRENNTAQIYLSMYPKKLITKILSKKGEEGLVEGRLGLAIGRPFYSEEKTDFKLLKGIDIERWRIRGHRYLKNKDKLNWEQAKKFLKSKVIAQRIVAHIENPIPHIKLMAAFDAEGIIITNTLMSFELNERINQRFWLAYLNSKFISWYTYNFIYTRAIRTMDFYNFYIKQIPIPKEITTNESLQKPFIQLVDQILSITKSEEYLDNPDKKTEVKKLEKEIDKLVYALYELTSEEIKIVEEFNGK